MPVTTGMGHFAMARASCSSLKGMEIFVAAATAYEQYDFDAGSKARAHAFDDVFRSTRAFDRNACNIDMRKGKPAARCAQNVMDGIAAWRGHYADFHGIRGHGNFSFGCHETFYFKLALEYGDLLAQHALARHGDGEHLEVHAPFFPG